MNNFTLDDVIAQVKEIARNSAIYKLHEIKEQSRTSCCVAGKHRPMIPQWDPDDVEAYCVEAEQKAVKTLFARLVTGRELTAFEATFIGPLKKD